MSNKNYRDYHDIWQERQIASELPRTTVIAEAGINFNASMKIAKGIIDVCVAAGVDAVKFQKREPTLCVPKDQWDMMRDTPWGKMRYIDYKEHMEFGKDEYDEIDRYCKEKGIKWSASPWDLPSLEFLLQYDIPWIKIPSAMLTNKELLKASAATGKKIILSTGMSTLDEIASAVRTLNHGGAQDNFVLMHCNSSYPAPINELNLSLIPKLKEWFRCEVGYSSHDITIGITVAAIYLGATYVEKHVTLNRSFWGTDQSCSAGPAGLFKMVSGIRELEAAYGKPEKVVTESEKLVRAKLRG